MALAPPRPPPRCVDLTHTADIQVHSWGPTLAASFEQAAMALYNYMCPGAANMAGVPLQQTVAVAASDLEELLMTWLDELLFRFQTPPYLVAGRVQVDALLEAADAPQGGYSLRASVQGDRYDRHTHQVGTEVKAITSSNLRVMATKPTHDIYVIFDI